MTDNLDLDTLDDAALRGIAYGRVDSDDTVGTARNAARAARPRRC